MKIPLYRKTAATSQNAGGDDALLAPSAGALVGKPFLKWVGGKGRLLSSLIPLLPRGRRLVEPFLGGGSVFLGTDFDEYILADTNAVLIDTYRRIQLQPDEILSRASSLFCEENLSADKYLHYRQMFNDPRTSDLDRASLFIYLNKFGFNGLYRENKKGIMNVPCAHHKKVPAFPADAIRRASMKLKFATLMCNDFAETLAHAKECDVVYCDPPYLDAAGAGHCFTAYTKGNFGLMEHRWLAESARELAGRGVPVMISNHDTPETRELYWV